MMNKLSSVFKSSRSNTAATATATTATTSNTLKHGLTDPSQGDQDSCTDDTSTSGSSTEVLVASPTKKIKMEGLPAELGDHASSPSTPASEMEECTICSEEYQNPNSWRVLRCSHKVCNDCYKKLEKTRSTMSGHVHTFIKCPFCNGISGIEIGDCPNGTMKVTKIKYSCTGYERFSSWSISYSVSHPKYEVRRTAYLPNNDEGTKILNHLQKAWDRRLIFTIGTSHTTGAEDVLVWNIHHKTSLVGGVSSYGYPDANYFDRVLLELKAYGIE